MDIQVQDLMTESVITTQRHHSIEHVRNVMETNRIHAIPVVDEDGKPLGIVSSLDLAGNDLKDGAHISSVMSDGVVQIQQYEKVNIAAQLMRKHHIHHLVVTHEKSVVGVISSMDLLELLDEKRFVMKNPPTPKKKRRGAA